MTTTIVEREESTATTAVQGKKQPEYVSSAAWGPAKAETVPSLTKEATYPSCLDLAAEFLARG